MSAQPKKRLQVDRSHVKKCQDVRFSEETAMKLYVEVGVGCCQPLECRLKIAIDRILQVWRSEKHKNNGWSEAYDVSLKTCR